MKDRHESRQPEILHCVQDDAGELPNYIVNKLFELEDLWINIMVDLKQE